jgi:hypothetical protein
MALAIITLAQLPFGGPFKMLLELLFFCAVGALLWWGFSKLALPEPVKTILMVVVGLILLFILYSLVFGGGFGGSG